MSFTTITLYKPNGEPITYLDPTRVSTDGGVLAFYWTRGISDKPQKVITNLPYMIQHDIMSVATDAHVTAFTQAGSAASEGREDHHASPAGDLLRSAARAFNLSSGAGVATGPGPNGGRGSSSSGQG